MLLGCCGRNSRSGPSNVELVDGLEYFDWPSSDEIVAILSLSFWPSELVAFVSSSIWPSKLVAILS